MERGKSSAVARSRLSVITAHLAADYSASSHGLETSSVSAPTAAVSPPPNLKGALTIIDERTGKKYQVPVTEEGTVKATDFKKVSFYACLRRVVSTICFDYYFIFLYIL